MGQQEETPELRQLVDIRDVKIPSGLPQAEKLKAYVSQIRDPYRFKVGAVIVSLSYAAENGEAVSLNDRFLEMLEMAL